MSSGEGPRGADRAIARLRWLLVSAQDDASARREVLPALSRCTVLVPTLGADKLRFLPRAGGGSSLVVFTGHDALEHAAKKHGWAQGTQSVSFRAMSARDALEVAEMQQLRSVIIDAAAEHALELKDEDVSLYLSRGTGEFSVESLKPSRGTGDLGPPGGGTSRGTGDHGQPRKKDEPKKDDSARGTGEFSPRGTGEKNVRDLREEVAPRKVRDARQDDDGGAPPAAAPDRAAPGTRRDQQPTQPKPRRRDSSESIRRKAKLAEIDDPFVSSTPRRAPSKAVDAGGQARRVPSLSSPPLSGDMPSSPFESSRPPSTPAAAPVPPARSRLLRDYSHIQDETIPLDDTSSAEAARDSAARASSSAPAQAAQPMSLPVADLPMVGFSDAPPAEPAPPARPVVAPAPGPAPARSAVKTLPPPLVSAPPAATIADAFAAHAAAPVKKSEPVDEREPRGTGTMPKPPADAERADKAPAEAAAQAAPASSAGADAPSQLSEPVLSAIADELRKFPEAEWACELDDADKHVIAIRVDPSYLTRTKDIEASVVQAAKRAGAAVQPIIVSTPAAMKDARARGRMFFPWKKK